MTEKITEIDNEILELFRKRIELTVSANGKEDGSHESSIDLFEKMLDYAGEIRTASGKTGEGYARYRYALDTIRSRISNPRVVYQGKPGAYSEIASMDYFGENCKVRGLRRFEDTFRWINDGGADYAVLPIENSTTGGIRQVYDLLAQYNYYLVGETYVKVEHNLMVLPGTKPEDIEVVYSHEQALYQCSEFLGRHPEWKQITQDDTAGSAKMIAESGNKHAAAICSSRAAQIYGLDILASAINDNPDNTTRFVVVSPRMELSVGRDKVAITLSTRHEAGSLRKVLSVFALHGLNLLRLESRPDRKDKWAYTFFIEFSGDLLSSGMEDVVRELEEFASEIRILGNFPTGNCE